MMKPLFLLRAAAIISALYALGHAMGGLQNWSPFGDNPVIEMMAGQRFTTMGVSRSYLELYEGFGWSIAVLLFLQAAFIWQLSSVARPDFAKVRPTIALLAAAVLAQGLVALRFILPAPVFFSAVIFVVLILAFVAAGRVPQTNA